MNKPLLPLSACFIAKHESDRLGAALRAVRGLCAETLVVIDPATDSDNTAAVAAAHGARVLHRAWTGFGEQKRHAEQNAAHNWILSLDADEVVTPELAAEIRGLFTPAPPHNSYRLRITEVYPHHARPRLWAEQTNVVRLFNRTAGLTSASATHDRVAVPAGAAVGQLQAPVLHRSIRSLAHLAAKYDTYTTLQAHTLKPKPKWLLASRRVTEFPMGFIKYYIGHRHFTGGLFGLHVAMVKAHARHQRIVKMTDKLANKS